MKFFSKYLITGLLISFFLCSCRQTEIFEKDAVIPGYKWQSNFKASGAFIITDTVSEYNIYIVIRHTDAYAYNNIWLNISRQEPGSSLHEQKLNLNLGNDAEGWEGIGMNDIWESKKLISGPHTRFSKAGEYRFGISQIMRDDPLEHVMSIGLRLEKVL